MRAWLLPWALLLAPPALHFDVTDARGKSTGIAIEAESPDESGWFHLSFAKTGTKSKGGPVLVWPVEATAAPPDGPEPVPAIVIQRGDAKALENPHVVAAMATPVALGFSSIEDAARETGFDAVTLARAFSGLATSKNTFERGVGLLYTGKADEAYEALSVALRERQRQLTRVPSEIYPLAMLCGRALMAQSKFDAAALEFGVALQQRKADERARIARNEALVKAGKPEAAQ
jgi:hypothetical protein